MTNPYASLPDRCFWSRGVTWVHPAQVDPMANTPFMIAPTDKVATMGSCFAQHISRRLQAAGFNYFVPETAPEGMSEAEAKATNYGVFSARYGNVYTVKQAVQLFERAFGEAAYDEVWALGDRFVDPFRPQIQPKGFATREALKASRDTHLAAVRRVFKEADVLVFTLGLTEAWRSIETGAVYPTAPGVAGGRFDPTQHEAVNYRVEEVIADLDLFITKARAVNPDVRIILTVSPVPLKATFEDRHVLQSTVYSKSVLRVAAQHAHDAYSDLVYFPSYEIITGPGSAGRYYAPDLREVRDVGVAHVMRIFEQHFIRGETDSAPAPIVVETLASHGDIVCDEDVIEAALELSRVEMKTGGASKDSGFNLSERDVCEGYRLFLGREPESQAVIDAHRGHPTLAHFRSLLLHCEEFQKRCGEGEADRLMKVMNWVTGQAHSAG